MRLDDLATLRTRLIAADDLLDHQASLHQELERLECEDVSLEEIVSRGKAILQLLSDTGDLREDLMHLVRERIGKLRGEFSRL